MIDLLIMALTWKRGKLQLARGRHKELGNPMADAPSKYDADMKLLTSRQY